MTASTHFKIVVPFYNVEKWIRATINSIKAQDYDDYECVLIDDLSSDAAADVATRLIDDDKRFHFISNKKKKYALGNTIQGIEYLKPTPEHVIMVLDGDDWFSSPSVLSRLNKEYEEKQCWMTYGSYLEFPSGNRGKFARQLPQEIITNNSFREYPWCTSQLRTFKYHLWQDIKAEALVDEETDVLYDIAGDLAYMFPMLEMTGNKSAYIKEILYIYNLETPLNDHKKDNRRQMSFEHQIRNKEKYKLKERNETH